MNDSQRARFERQILAERRRLEQELADWTTNRGRRPAIVDDSRTTRRRAAWAPPGKTIGR